MNMPPEYWPDIQRNCSAIMDDLSPAIVHPLPLVAQEVRSYEWPGEMDDTVTLHQIRSRIVPIGRRALITTVGYNLELATDTTCTTLSFMQNRPGIFRLKHLVRSSPDQCFRPLTEQRMERGRVFILPTWDGRDRLQEELERGLSFRESGS